MRDRNAMYFATCNTVNANICLDSNFPPRAHPTDCEQLMRLRATGPTSFHVAHIGVCRLNKHTSTSLRVCHSNRSLVSPHCNQQPDLTPTHQTLFWLSVWVQVRVQRIPCSVPNTIYPMPWWRRFHPKATAYSAMPVLVLLRRSQRRLRSHASSFLESTARHGVCWDKKAIQA